MDWNYSGNFSELEKKVAILMRNNGFSLKEIVKILHRNNPNSMSSNISKWKRDVIKHDNI